MGIKNLQITLIDTVSHVSSKKDKEITQMVTNAMQTNAVYIFMPHNYLIMCFRCIVIAINVKQKRCVVKYFETLSN